MIGMGFRIVDDQRIEINNNVVLKKGNTVSFVYDERNPVVCYAEYNINFITHSEIVSKVEFVNIDVCDDMLSNFKKLGVEVVESKS